MTARKKSPIVIIVIVAAVAVVLAVGVCGVLAVVAIPNFLRYQQQSKTAEAEQNLSALYTAAASYYEQERPSSDGRVLTGCVVDPAATDNVPGPQRTVLSSMPPSFEALGVSFSEPIYYRYEIESVGGCGHEAREGLYTFRARGDLDGDGVTSLYSLEARAGTEGDLERAGHIFPREPLE